MNFEKLNLTGISLIDGIVQLVLAVLAAWLFIIAASRMIKMFHGHQYGQLIATALVFFCIFFFLAYPSTVMGWFTGAKDSIITKVNSGGGGPSGG